MQTGLSRAFGDGFAGHAMEALAAKSGDGFDRRKECCAQMRRRIRELEKQLGIPQPKKLKVPMLPRS
jgi:hypothetical protein